MRYTGVTILMMCMFGLVSLVGVADAQARGGRGPGGGPGTGPGAGPGGSAGCPLAGASDAPGRGPGWRLPLGLKPSEAMRAEFEALGAQVVFGALQLQGDQKKLFIDSLTRYHQLEAAMQDKAAAHEAAVIPLLRKAAKEQAAHGVIPDATRQELAKLHQEFSESLRPALDEARELMKTLLNSLTQVQRERLAKARQQLSPFPLNADDDDADADPWALAFVDRLRLMPAAKLQRMKDVTLQRAQSGQAPLSLEKLTMLFSFIDEIRAMKAEDYEQRRSALAESLDPEFMQLIMQRHRAFNAQGRPAAAEQDSGKGQGLAKGPGMAPGGGPGMVPGIHPGSGGARNHLLVGILTSDSFFKLLTTR